MGSAFQQGSFGQSKSCLADSEELEFTGFRVSGRRHKRIAPKWLPVLITITENTNTAIPLHTSSEVRARTPFHSFNMSPQAMLVVIINAVKHDQAVNEYFPSLVIAIP